MVRVGVAVVVRVGVAIAVAVWVVVRVRVWVAIGVVVWVAIAVAVWVAIGVAIVKVLPETELPSTRKEDAPMPDTRIATLVTVCSSCLRASCWLMRFPCERWRTAGLTQKTIGELVSLGREHQDYWDARHA